MNSYHTYNSLQLIWWLLYWLIKVYYISNPYIILYIVLFCHSTISLIFCKYKKLLFDLVSIIVFRLYFKCVNYLNVSDDKDVLLLLGYKKQLTFRIIQSYQQKLIKLVIINFEWKQALGPSNKIHSRCMSLHLTLNLYHVSNDRHTGHKYLVPSWMYVCLQKQLRKLFKRLEHNFWIEILK